MLTVDALTPVERAQALFTSALPTGGPAGIAELATEIADALRTWGGVAASAAAV
jgi:hypothetical protein